MVPVLYCLGFRVSLWCLCCVVYWNSYLPVLSHHFPGALVVNAAVLFELHLYLSSRFIPACAVASILRFLLQEAGREEGNRQSGSNKGSKAGTNRNRDRSIRF